jgi:predicted SnoaL-like aldol condensation-catalyzing enzyme
MRAWSAGWKTKVMPSTLDTNVVRRVIDEIWNNGDIALADALFAGTYANHGGLIPDLVKGPEVIKFSVAMYRAAFPDLHISVDSLFANNGNVQLRWTARSGKSGDVGARHLLTGETISSVAFGQIDESWTTWDAAGALGTI